MTRSAVLVMAFLLVAELEALAPTTPTTPTTPIPELVLSATGHEFGEARVGQKLVHVFEFRNAGEAPLFLKFVGGSLPGITARAKRELAPGLSGTISVEWDTSAVEGANEAVVTYSTNDPALPELELTLRAMLYRPVSIEPFGAVFFTLWRGESAEQRLKILVRGVPAAKVVKLTPEGSHFTSAIETVTEGREYALVVRVPPSAEIGRFREHLTVETDHPEMSSMRVAVNVLVKPELFVGVDEVTFGELDPKLLKARPDLLSYLMQSFVVRRKEGPFEIRSITSDLPALTFERDPASGPAEAFRIDVGVAAERLVPGPLRGTIRIESSDPRFPELMVPVTGSVGSGE